MLFLIFLVSEVIEFIYPLASLITIHDGHVEIEENQIVEPLILHDLILGDHFTGFKAILCLMDM
jgi:hypothetical protein